MIRNKWKILAILFVAGFILVVGWQFSRAYETTIYPFEMAVIDTSLEARIQVLPTEPSEISIIPPETDNIAPEEKTPPISEINVKLPPVLERIAECESGGKQFEENGSVVTGRLNSKDKGKFQINEFYWGEKAKELGHDIYTLEGNTAMARWIFENHGTGAWVHSSKCWNS